MKLFALLFAMLLLFPLASSLTIYNITLKDQKIFVNATFNLTSQQEYDVWRISWEIPQKYEIVSITDEKGRVSFTASPGYVYFETNKLRAKERIMNIQYYLTDAISADYEPLKKVQLYLSGFENDKTIINVYLPGLISGDASFGFTEHFSDNFAQFVGTGAADIVLFYSFSGREYDNYILFGPADLSAADSLFTLVTNTTGIAKPYKRFPVVVLSDTQFERTVQPWGTASHTRGGLILIKKTAANNPYNASTILHETTHGINAKVLKWNQVNATWFEEGSASFIEFLANQHLGVEQPNLFGKDKVIKQKEGKIIIKSKGDREALWNYYKQGSDYMYYWNPSDSRERDFGYAFSELVIRYSVKKNGIEKLKEAYSKLSKIDKPIRDQVESANTILSALDANFMPCYSVDRSKFDECLDEINAMQLAAPKSNHVESLSSELVNETFVPTQSSNSQPSVNHDSSQNDAAGIIQKILQFLKNLFKPAQ